MQNAAFSKVHQQEPIIISFRKISEDETRRCEHRAIDCAETLLPKAGIFSAQFQEIDVQIVKLAISLPLRKVEFAP
jgi:hypothetical protein